MTENNSTDKSPALAPFSLFLLASLLLYAVLFPLLSWTVFSEDDSHLMRVAIDYAWWQHFFVPEVYRELSAANYTPIPLVVYKTLVSWFGLSTNAFLVFMLLAISLISALAATLTEQITRNRMAAWAVILLIFSSMSMHTLITRFYTMHYLIGGIFALTALVVIFRSDAKRVSPVLPSLFLLLALVSKEVYLVLPPLVGLYALYHRNFRLAIGAGVALLVYLILRTWMLGMSVDIGGESSYFAGFWGISGAAWLSFIGWYIKTRIFILAAVGTALLVNFRRTVMLLPLALIFAAPGLAVSHGIVEHTLHGDRIFFAFDCALAIVAIIAIAQSGFFQRFARPLPLLGMLALFLLVHVFNNASYRAQTEQMADYRITRFLLDNLADLEGATLFVPMNFIQGDLMRVNDALEQPRFFITQNCVAALGAAEGELFMFNGNGEPITREDLSANCIPASVDPVVDIAPRYNNGLLQWQVQFPDGFSGGVLFVDRAFAVPIPAFSQQLVKPAPGERYQLFANNGINWWFSDIEPMQIITD
ncbi:hypothetical protein [Pseudohongiella sp.]|uniref:Glycosyltransferase RgtA/B/C/D-like domain-containing protein n=1 Tax=marine sediment metagenome TaxID=412755 RepID=A0A0F9YVU7_9ZZZZ|nr:hypothetical protein [Pseudohongiella sp.]HDZ08010.1 hypothetical protein [Pseudohongiella sp.]HEA64147.1 hypothetical protein [Pseudohongiella sp.]